MRRAAAGLLALALGLPVASPAAPRGRLDKAIDRILDGPVLADTTWGVEVRSLRTGRVLYARNALKNVKPASTLKIVTTAATLDALGPDATLATTVETAGRQDAMGRILGDVFLVGGGDPNLSGRFHQSRPLAPLEALADQLRAAGVRRIEGRLVGHEGLFQGERRGEDWTWGDLVWAYGAEVSALSFNDNAVDLTVAAGEREGDPVVVERSPVSSYYRVISTATTTASGTPGDLRVRRAAGGNVIEISGTWPRVPTPPWGGSIALEDPARYAATVFREVLEARGIAVMGEVATSSAPLPATRRALARLESRPLSEILAVINKRSQNLHTEMMLRLLGARRAGTGTAEAGHAVVDEFLRRVGVRPDTWARQDASGLSRSDLVSPHEMVSLLAAMHRHPHAAAFRATLPVAGVDGTLGGRMKGTAAANNAAAKTGTLRHVNALAGYVRTKKGDTLAFYVSANHHAGPSTDATGAIDELVALLAES